MFFNLKFNIQTFLLRIQTTLVVLYLHQNIVLNYIYSRLFTYTIVNILFGLFINKSLNYIMFNCLKLTIL